MNRRTAMQAFVAGCAAPLAWLMPKKAAANASDFAITIPIHADTSHFREQVKRELDKHRDAEPHPPIKGELGKTFFRAGVKPDISSARLRCYFNGVDVHQVTYDADAVAGWARMFEMDGVGKRIYPSKLRVFYGKVEFRPAG